MNSSCDTQSGASKKVNVRLYCSGRFQDPKMEVLYHIRPYVVGIFLFIALT